MIFVTVGTQLPFERLILAMDVIARELSLEVVAQVNRMPQWSTKIRCLEKLSPEELEHYFCQAEVVVSHAGIGSVISARRSERPIVLFPRRSEKGEHRNDHQVATSRQLDGAPGVYIAWTEHELRQILLNRTSLTKGVGMGPEHQILISNLRSLIQSV